MRDRAPQGLLEAVLKTLLKLSLLSLIAVLVAAPAMASGVCADRARLAQQLERKYKETPRAIGLSSEGRVVEVFASESGSWTMIVTYPNGISCAIDSGEAWERLPLRLAGPAA
ncbi:MAG: hypothetical protein QNJ94_22185 [Alphaproteobacteria bacterium]|nr:hypothetical protein [Alphaproteobacteria bacterium]